MDSPVVSSAGDYGLGDRVLHSSKQDIAIQGSSLPPVTMYEHDDPEYDTEQWCLVVSMLACYVCEL